MKNVTEGKGAKRLLWTLVIGLIVLNVVLFLMYSRQQSPTPPSRSETNSAGASSAERTAPVR